MKPNYTEITLILDRSGSMHSVAKAAIAGVNQFIEDQKALPGEIVFTLVLFNHERQVPIERVPIRDVPVLGPEHYRPGGSTALLDAVGFTIDETGQRLAATLESDRPSKVIVAILTDGFENVSHYFRPEQVAARIRHQQDVYKWEFLFLAANQNAIREGGKLGIRQEATLTFDASQRGVKSALSSLSSSVASTLRGGRTGFTAADWRAQQPPNERRPPSSGSSPGKKPSTKSGNPPSD